MNIRGTGASPVRKNELRTGEAPAPHVWRSVMPEKDLSRREWVGLMSAPVVAAAISAAVPAIVSAQENKAPGANDLGSRLYNIRDFGAKGDGQTVDTQAVQAAIDACTKDQGGVVLVPGGTFVI